MTMTSSLHLQRRIEGILSEFLPGLHAYRRGNLAWLVTGIHEAQHSLPRRSVGVHLSRVASYRTGSARLTSKTRALRRFLANGAVEPGRYYRPMARALLEEAASHHDRLRLLMDVVELPGGRQVMMLALAPPTVGGWDRRRALPLMWHVWHGVGKTSAEQQVEFLIDAAERLEDLRSPPGNRLEALAGDRADQHSIRINQQWRICFRWEEADAYDVEITDCH